MVVIQHQDQLVPAGLLSQLVDQRRNQRPKRRRRGRAEQRANPLAESGPHPVQSSDGVAPEPGRVVVPRIQRQPGYRPPAAPGPVSQHRRLTEPGRGADQHDAPPSPSSSRLASRGRGTNPGRGPGTCNLVASRAWLSCTWRYRILSAFGRRLARRAF